MSASTVWRRSPAAQPPASAPPATDSLAADPLAAVPERSLERLVTLAFAPLHKRAFGVAVGVVAALALVLLTVADTVLDTGDRFPLGLLSVYLRGYEPTFAGILVGAAWAFGVGFVAGWFAAFMRNAVLLLSLVVTRARLQLMQSHDLLDHL